MKILFARAVALVALFTLFIVPVYAQDVQETAQPGTILAVLQDAGTFNTLISALEAAEMTAVLEGEGPYTLFAPTDEAFAKLPAGTVDEWMLPENKAKLSAILSNHVVEGQATPSDEATTLTALGGGTVIIVREDGAVRVNEASAVQSDLEASNGVVHVIDTVLLSAEGDIVDPVEEGVDVMEPDKDMQNAEPVIEEPEGAEPEPEPSDQ